MAGLPDFPIQAPQRLAIADPPADTVQVFHFSKGPWTPSTSPPVIKLLTFLRLAKIPYVNDHNWHFFPKTHKAPWIRYNGEEVGDSTMCIEYLKDQLAVEVEEGLTKEQKAIRVAFDRMADEHLFWVINYHGFQLDTAREALYKEFSEDVLEQAMVPYVRGQLMQQGMGRHDPDTVQQFIISGLDAYANLLGNKKFMMGDKPTQIDCSAFSIIACFRYNFTKGHLKTIIVDKYPSLDTYCQRVKQLLFPDWDDLITHGAYSEQALIC